MPQTLLEMVQDILSEIGGDVVTSISDTEEADFVARIIKHTYLDLSSKSNWPMSRNNNIFSGSATLTNKTKLSLDSSIKQVISIYYDRRESTTSVKNFVKLEYLNPDDFLVLTNKRNNTESNVETVTDTSGIKFLIYNDVSPNYYTSFDDVSVVFDSYDSLRGTFLQVADFQATGYSIPTFTLSNSFVPSIPPDAFSLLYNEALSRVQWRAREFQDLKAESEATKQSRWMSRNAFRVNGGIKYPNYGRSR
ncbi:hypothetical protein KC678_02015 [Candidatus Dojkabacteria bacterium]|uniref:Uncharacterized protein n=1 Tax=Candidatus Dojkabacteria bacterium TaxID=2099670 RepID=A0A955I8S3_9BACT|nr:hypothetical protein [Candidatus Dojkabacteria bacterium]